MKLNVSFLLVLCVWLSFSSCGEEETNTPPFLNIEHKALDFNTPGQYRNQCAKQPTIA